MAENKSANPTVLRQGKRSISEIRDLILKEDEEMAKHKYNKRKLKWELRDHPKTILDLLKSKDFYMPVFEQLVNKSKRLTRLRTKKRDGLNRQEVAAGCGEISMSSWTCTVTFDDIERHFTLVKWMGGSWGRPTGLAHYDEQEEEILLLASDYHDKVDPLLEDPKALWEFVLKECDGDVAQAIASLLFMKID